MNGSANSSSQPISPARSSIPPCLFCADSMAGSERFGIHCIWRAVVLQGKAIAGIDAKADHITHPVCFFNAGGGKHAKSVCRYCDGIDHRQQNHSYADTVGRQPQICRRAGVGCPSSGFAQSRWDRYLIHDPCPEKGSIPVSRAIPLV